MDAEKLEKDLKKMSGTYSDDIIAAIKELAEVDMKIKSALEEIERIESDLPPKHNELSDKINELVKKAAEELDESDSSEHGKHEKPKDVSDPKKIKVEIQVVRHGRPVVPVVVPDGLIRLLMFLNS